MGFAVTAIASVAAGAIIGVLSGLLGLGGGTMIVPVLKLGYLLPPIVCTGTSLLVVVLTAISGAVTHVKNRTCIFKLGVVAGLGGACMSPVGVWLASLSPDWAIMAAAAAVIIYSAVTMFRKALKAPKGGGGPRGGAGKPGAVSAADPQGAQALPAVTPRQLGIGFAIGLAAGLMGGYVGVGGGFIMVPLFMSLLKTPMRLTSGTSLLAVLILAIPGVVTQGVLGNIDWVAGIALAVGAIPGAVLGSHLVSRVPERTLRFLFSAILCVAAALLVADQL